MRIIVLLCFIFAVHGLLAAQDVTGFWKTVDEKTGSVESIVAIYEYQGQYYGRIVATYDENGNIKDTIYSPGERAPGVKGNPYYAGLDIIRGLKNTGARYTDGEIMDPEKGRIYGAELWVDYGNLIVRGKLLFFGRNQTWPPAQDSDFPAGFKKPDLTQIVPVIYQVI